MIGRKNFRKPVKLLSCISDAFIETKTALGRITASNPTLKTGYWTVIDVKTGNTAPEIVITAEPDVLEILKKIYYRAHYGLKRIIMKILANTKTSPKTRFDFHYLYNLNINNFKFY